MILLTWLGVVRVEQAVVFSKVVAACEVTSWRLVDGRLSRCVLEVCEISFLVAIGGSAK
jgi:hypothetical protein